MNARECLQQIKNLNSYIKTLQDQKEELWTKLTSTTVAPKDVNVISTKTQEHTTELLEKYMRAEDEINKVVDNYLALESKARKVVFMLQPLKLQTVLLKYYFQNKTFEQTAVEMDMSYQWICELHNRAIVDFEEKYEKF